MKLRIWWIPQIPMKAFIVPVDSVKEGVLLLDTLAKYDLFQFENRLKPDYANTGGLEQFNETDNDWESWYDHETGIDDPFEYIEYLKGNKC